MSVVGVDNGGGGAVGDGINNDDGADTSSVGDGGVNNYDDSGGCW